MTENRRYLPGDRANGYVLGDDNHWHLDAGPADAREVTAPVAEEEAITPRFLMLLALPIVVLAAIVVLVLATQPTQAPLHAATPIPPTTPIPSATPSPPAAPIPSDPPPRPGRDDLDFDAAFSSAWQEQTPDERAGICEGWRTAPDEAVAFIRVALEGRLNPSAEQVERNLREVCGP